MTTPCHCGLQPDECHVRCDNGCTVPRCCLVPTCGAHVVCVSCDEYALTCRDCAREKANA